MGRGVGTANDGRPGREQSPCNIDSPSPLLLPAQSSAQSTLQAAFGAGSTAADLQLLACAHSMGHAEAVSGPLDHISISTTSSTSSSRWQRRCRFDCSSGGRCHGNRRQRMDAADTGAGGVSNEGQCRCKHAALEGPAHLCSPRWVRELTALLHWRCPLCRRCSRRFRCCPRWGCC